MKFFKLAIFLIISSLALISCGGGGGGGGDDGGISYSGNTAQATVTIDNADELAVTSTSGSGMGVSSENAPMAFRSSETSNLEELSEKIYLALNATANRTANQTEDLSAFLCDQGGSVIGAGRQARIVAQVDRQRHQVGFEACPHELQFGEPARAGDLVDELVIAEVADRRADWRRVAQLAFP